MRTRISKPIQIWGAWLYQGEWDGKSLVPQQDWRLIKMIPGKFDADTSPFRPTKGQVVLLPQGDRGVDILEGS